MYNIGQGIYHIVSALFWAGARGCVALQIVQSRHAVEVCHFLAAIAALYVTMSVSRSDGRMVGRSDGRTVGRSVSTSFKVSSNTLEKRR